MQTAVTVFDLLDYYESCERLNISYNKNLGIRGWQACARFIKKVFTFVRSFLSYRAAQIYISFCNTDDLLVTLLLEIICKVKVMIVMLLSFVQYIYIVRSFPFCALNLLVWRQEGHPACKKLGVGLLVVMI